MQVSFQANPSRLKTDSPQLSHSYIGHPVFNNSHQTTGLRITYTNKLDTKIMTQGPRVHTHTHSHKGQTNIREWSSLLWETYLHKSQGFITETDAAVVFLQKLSSRCRTAEPVRLRTQHCFTLSSDGATKKRTMLQRGGRF